jgi:hypothetical protein
VRRGKGRREVKRVVRWRGRRGRRGRREEGGEGGEGGDGGRERGENAYPHLVMSKIKFITNSRPENFGTR